VNLNEGSRLIIPSRLIFRFRVNDPRKQDRRKVHRLANQRSLVNAGTAFAAIIHEYINSRKRAITLDAHFPVAALAIFFSREYSTRCVYLVRDDSRPKKAEA